MPAPGVTDKPFTVNIHSSTSIGGYYVRLYVMGQDHREQWNDRMEDSGHRRALPAEVTLVETDIALSEVLGTERGSSLLRTWGHRYDGPRHLFHNFDLILLINRISDIYKK
jgi:hypothetical protein